MSYVAEGRGGGPQDLLRRFDPSRNCKISCDPSKASRAAPGVRPDTRPGPAGSPSRKGTGSAKFWQQWLDLSGRCLYTALFFSISPALPNGKASGLASRDTSPVGVTDRPFNRHPETTDCSQKGTDPAGKPECPSYLFHRIRIGPGLSSEEWEGSLFLVYERRG